MSEYLFLSYAGKTPPLWERIMAIIIAADICIMCITRLQYQTQFLCQEKNYAKGVRTKLMRSHRFGTDAKPLQGSGSPWSLLFQGLPLERFVSSKNMPPNQYHAD